MYWEDIEEIKWKVNFDSFKERNTMPLDRAKIEALRKLAELEIHKISALRKQAELLDEWLPKIFQQLIELRGDNALPR